MERMVLSLKLRPAAAERLESLLAEQQEPSSPNYHRWLTPEEFGNRFGAASEDLALAVD
jgi:subtilase family serine protease